MVSWFYKTQPSFIKRDGKLLRFKAADLYCALSALLSDKWVGSRAREVDSGGN